MRHRDVRLGKKLTVNKPVEGFFYGGLYEKATGESRIVQPGEVGTVVATECTTIGDEVFDKEFVCLDIIDNRGLWRVRPWYEDLARIST